MNVIEFPADRINYRERDVANEGDVSSIRARATPLANEPDGLGVPDRAAEPLDRATQARMKQIRDADRRKVEALLKRDAPTDEGVKPLKDAPRPLKSHVDENAIRPKPLFERSGYEVPKSVKAQYVSFDGKYLDRKSETVHFEDKGRSLATESESRDVIAHMVEVAKAKHWGELQLKGTEEFRRQAWIAAELAGVPSRGFKPSAQDRALLQSAREAMRIGAAERAAGDPSRDNTMESVAAAPANERHPAQEKGQEKPHDPPGAGPAPTPPNPPSGPPAPADSAQQPTRPGVTAGVLLEHGAARFNHDPKQNDSYFVKVTTPRGERTVWGLDLERAMAESGVQPGQRIELEKGGSKVVTAQRRQFDEQGNELAPKTAESRRVAWQVSSPDVPRAQPALAREELESIRREMDERRAIDEARERFLSGNWQYTPQEQAVLDAARERLKEHAARAVLEDQIKGLKPQDQERARGEFESAVADARANDRPLDVPMPQVSERTIENVRAEIVREQRAHQQASHESRSHEEQSHRQEAPTLEIDQ